MPTSCSVADAISALAMCASHSSVRTFAPLQRGERGERETAQRNPGETPVEKPDFLHYSRLYERIGQSPRRVRYHGTSIVGTAQPG
jgi:hypothetical protein